MKNRFRVLIIAISAMFVMVAVACGGGDADDSDSSAAAPTTAPATVKAAEPTAKPADPPASSSGGINRGGQFIYGVSSNFPTKWDMTQDSVYTSPQHLARHYNGLLQFAGSDGSTIIPSLASDWEIAGDATEFTLSIPSGLKWHDGTAVTIDDVVWAVERWVDPPEGILVPRVAGFKSITSVASVGSDQIKITIGATNVGFLLELADPWHIIVPRHIAEGGIDSAEKVIGTGPWMVDSFERDNFVTSEPNPDYHRDAPDGSPFPYLDTITSIQIPDAEAQTAALKTGRIDMLSEVNVENAFNFENDEGDKFLYNQWINPGLTRLGLNNTKPPFDNVKAREAVYLAIDRGEFLDILQTPGLPQTNKQASFFGSTDPAWDDVPKLFGYDPATRDEAVTRAKALAEESGLLDFNGKLSILTNKGGTTASEVLQQLLDQSIGLKVNIEVTDTASMFARYAERDFDLGRYGTGVLHASPMSQILADWAPGAGRNYGWVPPQNWLDKFDEAKRTLQGPELDAIFAEMDRIMREEWIPSVPLERTTGSTVITYPYVKDFVAVPGCKFKCFQMEDVWVTADAPSGR